MARPLNKQQLLEFAEKEYKRLIELIGSLSDDQRDHETVFENRTAKDIVAHLYAWQLLELGWYQEGMKGKKPSMPAPGFSFKDTPALNEKLYQEYKNISWQTLINNLTASHNQLLEIIDKHNNEELFTKKKYGWTGSTDMAVYFRSALSSHYVWAIDLIRKHFKK
jgi:hypothetical protein